MAELAARRYAEREATTRARQAREQRKPLPPDGDHEWLTASQAARVLGMSPMGVYKRVHRGAIPYTDHRGRYWFRRDHMELMRNARAGSSRSPRSAPRSHLAAEARERASDEEVWSLA